MTTMAAHATLQEPLPDTARDLEEPLDLPRAAEVSPWSFASVIVLAVLAFFVQLFDEHMQRAHLHHQALLRSAVPITDAAVPGSAADRLGLVQPASR